jgi:integrase
MGQKKMSGLVKRGNIWHVDKRVGGRRIQCSTETTDLNRAQEFLIHLMEQERRGRVYGDPVPHLFVDACARYVKEMTKKSRDRDIQDLKTVMPYIGHLELKQIHLGTLQRFIDERGELGIKSSTMNRTLCVVRLVLKKAASIWRDDHDNTWLTGVPEIPKLDWRDARPAYPINEMQQGLLMKHLNAEFRTMMLWLVNTGLRSNELLNLRWSWRRDIPELGTFVFDIPGRYTKSKKDRVVVLNRIVRSTLGGLEQGGVDLVFANQQGDKRDKIRTTHWLTARERAANEFEEVTGQDAHWGFRNLRVHDLRHTFATRLRRSGVGIEVRKDLLAHRNLDVTTGYSAGELAELLEAVERLVGSECLQPTEPSKNGKVLQFPYNGVEVSQERRAKSLICMVATGGLEPPTPAL